MNNKLGAPASTTILNEEERPRVLIVVSDDRRVAFKFLESRPGSFRYVQRIGQVDVSEYDVVVIDRQLATLSMDKYVDVDWMSRDVPLGVNVFYIHDPRVPVSIDALDCAVAAVEEDTPVMVLVQRSQIPGRHAVKVSGLPDELQSLVSRFLVPVMNERTSQFGHDFIPVSGSELGATQTRPFLVGPSDLIIAASYSRAPGSEAWILPFDLPDFEPWYDLALDEWHQLDPSRFPDAPRWVKSAEWMTTEEKSLVEEIQNEETSFEPALTAHEARINELQESLEEVTGAGDVSDRYLLTSQGDELQDAVKQGLEALGFIVRDMDLEWNERERREDYRISDPAVPSWVAVADAAGVSKGVKGAKITVLGSYTTKYVLEERPGELPSQWLLVNHFINRDPNSRPNLLRADDVNLFASSLGLAFDTAALFLLVQLVKSDPTAKESVRAYLRESTGQLGMKDARAWILQRDMTTPT